MTYEEWEDRLLELNERINSMPEWNEQAEALQCAYDRLLEQEPKKDEEGAVCQETIVD
jgi:hypothetical protein